MFDLAMGQFYTCEQKLKYIRGDARKRIVAVLKYRPEIVEVVSARTLASYIGVTESYFCRIRKEMRLAGRIFRFRESPSRPAGSVRPGRIRTSGKTPLPAMRRRGARPE